MVTLPLLTQSFACPYPESTCSLKASVFLCDYQPSSPQTVSANPPESTSLSASSPTARSTSPHSQVPELQFLGWGDIFSCFSSSSEELRSLKFILKQQALGRCETASTKSTMAEMRKGERLTVKMIGLCDLILEWQAIRDTAGTMRGYFLRNSWKLSEPMRSAVEEMCSNSQWKAGLRLPKDISVEKSAMRETKVSYWPEELPNDSMNGSY